VFRLPFRRLARRYGAEIVYSPMIMADSFVDSEKARNIEFTTGTGKLVYLVTCLLWTVLDDRLLIVQFASRAANDLANATQLIAKYSDGVDLNCGCPQR
jgi:tRNA-dihydrouridine synthase 4